MKKYAPLLAGLTFVAVTVAALEYLAMKKTGGHFCYPLDDPFIHMALAKNVLLHGNWGINASGFTSTSSSPLFTILLTLLFKVTESVFMPLVLSCAGTVIALVAMQRELSRHSALSTVNQGLLIIITLLVGTMPAMTVEAVGYGAGDMDLDAPNVLRVFVGRPADSGGRETIMQVETTVDDMQPQLW